MGILPFPMKSSESLPLTPTLSPLPRGEGAFLRPLLVTYVAGVMARVVDRTGEDVRTIMSAALVAMSLTCASEAAAECVCGCIDGQLGVICNGSMQAPPVCAPRVCPVAPSSMPPRVAQLTPPPGTTRCFMAQVLNPSTGQYEWTEVCR